MNCTECIPTDTLINNQCFKCTDFPGFAIKETTGNVEECMEICGDGIRPTELHECDDGNLVGGDGCSHYCVIEFGFKCDDGQPSICQESIPPLAEVVQVTAANVVVLQFSEEVVFSDASNLDLWSLISLRLLLCAYRCDCTEQL